MRYLFIILSAVVCNVQGQFVKAKAIIDTVRLFDPFPSNENTPDYGMFKNAIAIFYANGYDVRCNSTPVKLKKLSEVSEYIAKKAATIKKKKFYILIDSNTRFEKTVSIIDILKKNRIDNYKVINHQQYFSSPETPEVLTPTVTSTPARGSDSTVFSITLLPDGIEVKVREKSAVLKDANELDEFIINNKSSIDTNKITIIGDRDLPYDKFKPVIEVFKKHGFYKFSMITK
jgi:biopolymer transport protein ExbD